MDAINRLEELAKEAEQMPWENSRADVPYSARQAFRDGCDPSTILRLVRVARAAKEHDAATLAYRDTFINRPGTPGECRARSKAAAATEEALRAALAELT
jgi:hypothetical protein